MMVNLINRFKVGWYLLGQATWRPFFRWLSYFIVGNGIYEVGVFEGKSSPDEGIVVTSMTKFQYFCYLIYQTNLFKVFKVFIENIAFYVHLPVNVVFWLISLFFIVLVFIFSFFLFRLIKSLFNKASVINDETFGNNLIKAFDLNQKLIENKKNVYEEEFKIKFQKEKEKDIDLTHKSYMSILNQKEIELEKTKEMYNKCLDFIKDHLLNVENRISKEKHLINEFLSETGGRAIKKELEIKSKDLKEDLNLKEGNQTKDLLKDLKKIVNKK